MQPSATLEYAPLSNGETYAYRDYGLSDNVIMFVHGNFSSSYFFETIFPLFTDKYRVIAVDLRGFGHSTNHTSALSTDDLAEDLKLFADHLKLAKFALLGWSLGGGVVMKFAARYPQYVSKLILCHAMGVQGVAFNFPSEDETLPKVRAKSLEEIKTIPMVLMGQQTLDEQDAFKAEKRLERLLSGRNKPTPEALKGYVSESLKMKSSILAAHMINSYNISEESNGVSEGTGEIKKIQCPVLMIYGSDDVLTSVEEAEKTKKLLGEKAELKVFEQAGHFAILHYPEEIASLIKEFISK